MVAITPTQYPAPTSQRGNMWAKSLNQSPLTTRRQPDLGQAARVSAITGFGGTGAGAGTTKNGADSDQSQGQIDIIVGQAPSASGTIVLSFPAGVTTGLYSYFCSDLTLAPQAPVGALQTINWTANGTLRQGQVIKLSYYWAVSL